MQVISKVGLRLRAKVEWECTYCMVVILTNMQVKERFNRKYSKSLG